MALENMVLIIKSFIKFFIYLSPVVDNSSYQLLTVASTINLQIPVFVHEKILNKERNRPAESFAK